MAVAKRNARGCPPAAVVEAARLAGLRGRASAAKFAPARGRPVWLVYAVQKKHAISAYAIDAHTHKLVYDYSRLAASGGYRDLNYLNVGSRTWAFEGGGLLVVLVGIYVWARSAWRRTLLSLDGRISTRIWARLRRLFFEVAWGGTLAAIAYGCYDSARTGAPPIIGATAVGGAIAIVLWVYASFAVVRSGVFDVEQEVLTDVAAVGGDA